jgi:putative membrane protein
MPDIKLSAKNKNERLLVLAVDIDNDLYKKTKISGPVLGRVQNLNAATQLALADPEETDANTMFEAVKLYDDLKKEGYTVNVATITGAEVEGYSADREISRQLDLTLAQYKSDACIFVTDGASDERVLPIIESRIKINGVRVVTMKQAEKLESTYFVILEKLKDPHYARIIFGIPAILLLLFAISYVLGAGWEAPVALIGAYLLIKGFGLEDALLESFRGFGFSIDKMSFVFYLGSIIFFIASLFIAYGNYATEAQITSNQLTIWAYTIEGFLLLLPFTLIIYLIGRIIDVKGGRYIFRSFKYGTYIGSSIILWIMLYAFVAWIIGQIYFSQLLLFTVVAVLIGIGISMFTSYLRKRSLRSKRLKDKIVVNELGALIGKIANVDMKKGNIVVSTSFGNPISYTVDRIVDVSEKVVIK